MHVKYVPQAHVQSRHLQAEALLVQHFNMKLVEPFQALKFMQIKHICL